VSPQEAVALLSAEHGEAIRVVRALPGGGARTHEVVWPPAGRGVLKRFIEPAHRASVARALPLVEHLAARGYPVPRVAFSAASPDALVVVQTWCPGAAADVIDHSLVDDVLALRTLQVAVGEEATGESWGAFVLRATRQGLRPDEGFCLHAPLQEHSARTARLLQRVGRCVDGMAPTDFVARDVTHGDLHHGNILVDRGRVAAVVDWDGARVGDAAYDLTTLAFCAECARRAPGAVDRLWAEALRLRPRAVVTAYVALLAVRQVDWAVRNGTPADVALWLGAAEAELDRR